VEAPDIFRGNDEELAASLGDEIWYALQNTAFNHA
jgi:hypothetical protein